ncbi:MAG: hypothetical protein JSV36_02820, partial [Anaerolineae bacterium]
QDRIMDADSDIVYNRYGEDGIINAATGIVYKRLQEGHENYEGAVEIGGTWYLLNRRHLKPPALKAELETAGFCVLYQGGEYGGDLICVLAGTGATLCREHEGM